MISSVGNAQTFPTVTHARHHRHAAEAESTGGVESGDPSTSAAQTGWLRGPSPAPPSEALAAAAKVLGMSTDEVTSALQSGSTLKDLAAAKGVSQSDLQDAVVKALSDGFAASAPAGTAAAATTPSADRLQELATHLINGDPPRAHRGHHGGGHHGANAASDLVSAGSLSVGGTDQVASGGATTASACLAYQASSAPASSTLMGMLADTSA